MIFSTFSYRPEVAREFPGFGRPQTLRTRGIRGVGFSRASVARVWRVLGRSNPGNSRADVISKNKNSRISMVCAFRNAPYSRNSRGRFYGGALWLEFGVFGGAQTLEILERMCF